ncbi:metallophosphoesterase [Caloranaerobacter sp. DY30410]|uniref:metallophosphoesterase n=1 Tax=Caloranaerobacter sp. DY30410 TaxID=3238305 RepID=UPI003D05C5FA
MKLIVLSDTHGNINSILREINKIENIDLLIHLGDYSKDVDKLREMLKVDIINVRGNCDFYDYNTKEEEIIQVKGKKILLTHGHRYNVKFGINNLYYRSKELGVDIALFGHSHVPVLLKHDGVLFFNPGSPTQPRGGSKRSYGILDIDDEVKPILCKFNL